MALGAARSQRDRAGHEAGPAGHHRRRRRRSWPAPSASNRLIASLLFGVQPTDPATLAAVTATMTLVAAIACWIPAWRAAVLPPMVAMRDQPDPMWRTARLKVRRAIRELAAGSDGSVVPSVTLISEFTGLVQRAASFSEALRVALPALRERAGAQFIMLLEKVSSDEYRGEDCSIPARGVLINRLDALPASAAADARRLPGLAAVGQGIPAGACRRDRAARAAPVRGWRWRCEPDARSSACCSLVLATGVTISPTPRSSC